RIAPKNCGERQNAQRVACCGALQQQIGHRPQSSSASPSRAGAFGFVLILPMEKASPTIFSQTALSPPSSFLRLRLASQLVIDVEGCPRTSFPVDFRDKI